MRTSRRLRLLLALTFVALVAALTTTTASARPDHGGGGQIISVTGQSNSRADLFVDVVVMVPAGANASEASAQALAAQNARPISPAHLGSDGFDVTGLDWTSTGGVLSQSYNSSDEPLFAPGIGPLQTQWSGVTSGFSIVDAGTTVVCGSLIKECPGPQHNDGENTIQWIALKGSRNTLGVAWSTKSTPEVDIGLNLAFDWSCCDASEGELAEAVALHEIGHAVGLGHSADPDAVMHKYIDTGPDDSSTGPVVQLTDDDREGVRYLYGPTITLAGTVTVDGQPAASATVRLAGTDLRATTGGTGDFSITGVPDGVTYDIVATSGDSSSTTRLLVEDGGAADTDPTGGIVDVGPVNIATTGGGGGSCKPSWHPKCA
jgi:hypothetical protein